MKHRLTRAFLYSFRYAILHIDSIRVHRKNIGLCLFPRCSIRRSHFAFLFCSLPICRCSLGSSSFPLFLSPAADPATTSASPWTHASSHLSFLTEFCKNPNVLLHDSPTLEVLVPKLQVEQRRTKRLVAGSTSIPTSAPEKCTSIKRPQ